VTAVDFRKRFTLRIWRPAVDDEVDAELAFHLDMRRRDLMAGGMSETEARRTALERFGDYRRTRRECRVLGRRREQRMRLLQYIAELLQDVAFAVRQMMAAPGFTFVAVATLAIGIGATTAIFSAVHSVVLRPLPFAEPDRVMHVSGSSRVAQELIRNMGLANAHFLDLAEQQQVFDSLAATRWSGFTLAAAGTEGAERVVGARVTGGYFHVFRVPPAIGGVFGPGEDVPGRDQVVVLSHRLWRQHFGEDPAIVGRTVLLNQRPHTVLGVMPASFDFTADSEALWLPMAWTPAEKSIASEHNLTVVGRLRENVSPTQADQQVAAIAERRRQRDPGGPERGLHVAPLLHLYVDSYRQIMFVLLGAVACVLLIGCGNVSNLLLARGTSRGRELALRSALGAGQGRLVRQLFTENLVLGLLAAAIGAGLAHGIINLLVAFSPPGVPRLEQARIDATALGVAVILAIVASVLSGLVPVRRASRADVNGMLKEGGRGALGHGGRDVVRSTLIAGEVALALVLLVGAGLLIRSALETQRVDPGFNPGGLFSGRVLFPEAKYPTAEAALPTLRQLEEAVAALPGVRAVALAHTIPSMRSFNNGLVPEGLPNDLEHAIQSDGIFVSPGYFQAIGQRIVRGRAFLETDHGATPPVTVINETLARVLWPGQDALGKRVHNTSQELATVVGIVADVRAGGPSQPVPPTFYQPLAQMEDLGWGWINRSLFIIARAEGDPAALGPALRRTVASIDPALPLFGTMTVEERMARTLRVAQFTTMLLSALGAIGLLLAAIGIYGVIAYYATQRTSEIGIRMALGASRADVVRLILRQAAIPLLAGTLVGALGAVLATTALASQLVNVRSHDPLTFAAVAAGLLMVALFAALIPARRAAAMNPTRALQAG
jgi:putative ABC transport system permease protein